MSDETMKVGVELDVNTTGEEIIQSLRSQLAKLNADIRNINASMKAAARGLPQPGRPTKPTKETAANGGGATRSQRAKAKGDADAVKSAQRLNIFDREAVRLFRTKLSSQTKAASDSLKAEKQAFQNFRTRNEAQARYESAQVRAVRNEIATRSRMTKQRISEESAVARNAASSEAASIRAVREKIAANSRMARQRMSAERDVARESVRAAADAQREHDNALRRRIGGDRWRFQLRDRMERQATRDRQNARSTAYHRGNDALHYGGNAYSRLSRPGAVAAAAGTAASMGLGRKALGAEADIDAAEINSRIYAGLSKDAARDLRDKWAAPLAESLGVNTAKMLTSFTDAVKLGIPTEGAKQFSELATKTSEAWGVPFESVTDILGTVNTLLTSTGDAFNYDKLKSTANALQYLAAKQSTTPEKLISFLQRGAGAAQVLGMSQEAGLAFGSASTSLGNQAGQSGRMFDYVASRLIEMPRLTKKKGDEGKQAKDLVRALGYSSVEEMDKKRRSSPDDFMPDFMERFSKIKDPKRQEQLIRFFTGREWLGEFGRMVKGIETYKEANKLAKEAKGLDAIGEVWELHRTKLAFVFKQFKAGWLNILGEFGKVLSPLARQAGDYFLEWSRKLQSGGLQARFRAAIDGLLQGFGFKDLPDMLKGMFGAPGEGEAGTVEKWKATAKAFAEGIRDVFGTIRAVASSLTGGDPEIIARWTGRVIALSAALLVLSPVLSVIGGLATAILALAAAAKAGSAILKLAGLGTVAAGAGSAAGTGAGAANAAKGGLVAGAAMGAGSGILAALSRIWAPFSAASDTGLSKADQDKLTLRLGEWAKRQADAKQASEQPTSPSIPNDPRPSMNGEADSIRSLVKPQSFQGDSDFRNVIHKASFTDQAPILAGNIGIDPRPEIRELTDAVNDNSLILKQNFEKRNGFASLVHHAATAPADTVRSSLTETANGVRSSVLSGSTGMGTMTGGSAPLEGSVPGSRINGGGGLGYRGIIGGAMSGRGAGFGSGGGTPLGSRMGTGGGGMVGFGANPGAYKPVLDYIAGTEGTANQPGGGYNTSLGYGKFLPGGQEQNLTGKTLDEIDAMQTGMLNHPQNGFNSSAIGRYQIVRKTLRGLRQKLGLKGTDLYDEKMQDRLGGELVRQRGANANGLGQEWASLRGGKAQQAAGLVGQIPGGSSTTPSDRPISDGVVGPVTAGAAGNVADNAAKLIGMGSSQAAQSLGARMTPGSWCGDFVNGALKSANIRGVNSSIANSFLTWGKEVTDGVKAGDVLVEHRGRGVGQTGGHAGIATGRQRTVNGQLQFEQVSGNYGGRVARNWENASGVIARRAMESTTAAVEAARMPDLDGFAPPRWKAPTGTIAGGITGKANEIRSSGWRPGLGGNAPSALGAPAEGSPGLGESVPVRVGNTQPIGGGASGGNGKGGSPSTSNVIHINGTNMDPNAIANAVQRKLSEDMNRRTHDISPSII